jgi:hypothetical protein
MFCVLTTIPKRYSHRIQRLFNSAWMMSFQYSEHYLHYYINPKYRRLYQGNLLHQNHQYPQKGPYATIIPTTTDTPNAQKSRKNIIDHTVIIIMDM